LSRLKLKMLTWCDGPEIVKKKKRSTIKKAEILTKTYVVYIK